MENKPFLVVLAIGVIISSVVANYLFNRYVYPLPDQLADAGIIFEQDDQSGVLVDKNVTGDGVSLVDIIPSPVISLDNNSPYKYYNEQIKSILPQLRRGMVAFTSKNKNTGELIIKGYGLVLSNDGWIITWPDLMSGDTTILDSAGQPLLVEKYKDDNSTGLRFLKVQTENLYVLKLANQDSIYEGDFLLAVDLNKNVKIGHLFNLNYFAEKSQTLSVIQKRYGMDFSGKGLSRGLPIFNLEAEVVGLVDKNENGVNIVLPIYYAYNNLDEVFSDKISVLNLPIEYFDLAFQVLASSDKSKGALLLKSVVLTGKDKKSVSLFKNDIIVKVDGQELNSKNGLFDVLSQYSDGQLVELEILRSGQTVLETIMIKRKF
jgi:S1-C subfamily serine protease